MAIADKEIKHLARLARIAVDDKDLPALREDLSAILDWVAMLEKVELKTGEHLPPAEEPSTLREDKTAPSPATDTLLGNAPAREGAYFSVPKTVE